MSSFNRSLASIDGFLKNLVVLCLLTVKDAFLLDLCSPGSDWFRVQFPLETFLFYFFRLIQRIWLIFIIGKYYGLNLGAWQFFPCCKWWIRAILSRRSVQGWPNFSKVLANFFQMSLKNWAPWTERLLRKRLLCFSSSTYTREKGLVMKRKL